MYESSTNQSVKNSADREVATDPIRASVGLLFIVLVWISRIGYAQSTLGPINNSRSSADKAATPEQQEVRIAPEELLKRSSVFEEADKHQDTATKYFKAGQYESAIREWEIVYQLDPIQVITQFQIAQSYRRAGKTRDARRYFHYYLEKDPHTSLRNEVQNYIVELDNVIALEDQRERERRRPVWRKPWFWGVLGTAMVATGVSLGVGLGYGLRDTRQPIDFSF